MKNSIRRTKTTPLRRITLPLLLATAGLMLVNPCMGQGGTWIGTGSLVEARERHTATLLPDDKVLVAGGYNGLWLASAELYDAASGTWTVTGSLTEKRDYHTATLLLNGKVIVAGGYGGHPVDGALASAELYDPASGIWTVTGSLASGRYYHTATLLPNGKVLVAGGSNYPDYFASAELYDPATGTWTVTGSLKTARGYHTATLLPNGKVLVAGGFGGTGQLASAELYDPTSGVWTATGSLNTARRQDTATLLSNGKVLVAGGFDSSGYSASAELYDPASETWTATGSLVTGRFRHTGTLLPNGKVLVAGGYGSGSDLASAELYDPASGTWMAPGSLADGREDHTTTLLLTGKVLAAGGFMAGRVGTLASAELYVSDGDGELTLLSAASRLTHGSEGDFDINMPLGATSGVEDRALRATHAVFNFNAPVTSGDVTVTGGSATAGTPSFNGNTISVPLTEVADAQIVTLTVSNVNGESGSTTVDFGFLIGDVNGDHRVNRQDGQAIRADRGQVVDGSNFTEDLNLNGRVSNPDLSIVQTNLGNSIP